MTYYQRNLPHWHPFGKAIFLTWRLHGSLPASVLSRLKDSPIPAGRQFRYADKQLDKALFGPVWLKDDRIAQLLVTRLRRGACDFGEYLLHAFVVMANHVHVLIEPKKNLARITSGIKGATAREANLVLRRTGTSFWQDESFDHWVRNSTEFERIRLYIEWNPVTAGLVEKPEHWPWSSASSTGQ